MGKRIRTGVMTPSVALGYRGHHDVAVDHSDTGDVEGFRWPYWDERVSFVAVPTEDYERMFVDLERTIGAALDEVAVRDFALTTHQRNGLARRLAAAIVPPPSEGTPSDQTGGAS